MKAEVGVERGSCSHPGELLQIKQRNYFREPSRRELTDTHRCQFAWSDAIVPHRVQKSLLTSLDQLFRLFEELIV